MPRPPRTAPGGFVYHVLNRANGKRTIFHHDRDYLAFEKILAEAQERVEMRTLAWCVMPNHWHLLLWPRKDRDLSEYMRLVAVTHTQRLHAFRKSSGMGHVYQGRYKSFIVQHDAYFLSVARYVEANALSAGLVERAEDWRWSSAWRLERGRPDETPFLEPWPVRRPGDWLAFVNREPDERERKRLQLCARRGCPYGDEAWVARIAADLGL